MVFLRIVDFAWPRIGCVVKSRVTKGSLKHQVQQGELLLTFQKVVLPENMMALLVACCRTVCKMLMIKGKPIEKAFVSYCMRIIAHMTLLMGKLVTLSLF